ncbi:MAG: B12-binding domain-containing radical SAM protein [Lachnospiraceae bacterium]|nr:B12-binding domain-containing radical SAM protein [Lachnospiraceae bacterium]
MKILLTAINAKFIHSNPAVYSLRAYAGEKYRQNIEIAEYTINNKTEEILADIYNRKPDVVAFSYYIWNREMINSLLTELPKVLPDADIWLGGPEASYDAYALLKNYQSLTGVMIGEGEETFREIVKYYYAVRRKSVSVKADAEIIKVENDYQIKDISELSGIQGIAYRVPYSTENKICFTSPRQPIDMSKLPFLYEDLSSFENRIIYYESSRGCPYSCSYCLSSIDKTVRFRDVSVVKKELKFFLDNKVKQVKFVDRTFNCNKKHALEIWEFLLENDNGVTNFHFEIAAEIISDEEIEVLAKMRPGLVKLEIGVQTVNPETLKEIRRVSDINKLRQTVKKIAANRNIHMHLDLIAGLPYEDYESFRHSFNTVYAMEPDELQLGFLKVLKGSYMHEKVTVYELKYTDIPPYEVLSNKWLSYDNILSLKRVEEMLELYYNSNQFEHILPVLQTAFADAFEMYEKLADFYKEKGYLIMTPSRNYRYQVLLDFAMNTELASGEEMLKQILTFDLYLRENAKSRPEFAKDLTKYKQNIRDFYEQEEKERVYLPAYSDYDGKQLAKMTHIEIFDYPVWEDDVNRRMKKLDVPCKVLFDYKERNPITYAAKFTVLSDFSTKEETTE